MAKTHETKTDKPTPQPDPVPLSNAEIAKLEQEAVANDANNRK